MNVTLPPAIAPSSLALRVVSRSGNSDWLILVTSAQLGQLIDDLVENMRAFGGDPSTVDMTGQPIEKFVDSIAMSRQGTVLLVYGLDGLTGEDWNHIDLLRSQLLDAGTIVLLVALGTAERISRNAPNLSSWIGGSIWALNPAADSLSVDERSKRLTALRQWSKLTDQEVIQRAKDGSLPDDPEYTEWLILLDRADLVAPQLR